MGGGAGVGGGAGREGGGAGAGENSSFYEHCLAEDKVSVCGGGGRGVGSKMLE